MAGMGMRAARRLSSFRLVSRNEGRSTRSCGGEPQRQSSEKTARCAPRDFASLAISSMRAALPAKSPTVGLNWAKAIFIEKDQNTEAEGNLQTRGALTRRGMRQSRFLAGC